MSNRLFWKKAIVAPCTVGLQWVGWMWMVVVGQMAPPRWNNVAVAAAITANEMMGCQVFGRLVDRIQEDVAQGAEILGNSQLKVAGSRQPEAELEEIEYTKNQKYLKVGLSSTFAGNIFYVVDNAVFMACTSANLSLPSTLALRCVAVGIADMLAFQIGAEAADIIKSKKCSRFQMFEKNLSDASEAGILAVAYDLGSYIGDVISNACSVENESTSSGIASLCIFASTAIASSLKYLVGTYCCSYRNRIYPV